MLNHVPAQMKGSKEVSNATNNDVIDFGDDDDDDFMTEEIDGM